MGLISDADQIRNLFPLDDPVVKATTDEGQRAHVSDAKDTNAKDNQSLMEDSAKKSQIRVQSQMQQPLAEIRSVNKSSLLQAP